MIFNAHNTHVICILYIYIICSYIIFVFGSTAIDRIYQFTQGEVQMAAKLKPRRVAIPLRQGEHLATLLRSI